MFYNQLKVKCRMFNIIPYYYLANVTVHLSGSGMMVYVVMPLPSGL